MTNWAGNVKYGNNPKKHAEEAPANGVHRQRHVSSDNDRKARVWKCASKTAKPRAFTRAVVCVLDDAKTGFIGVLPIRHPLHTGRVVLALGCCLFRELFLHPYSKQRKKDAQV